MGHSTQFSGVVKVKPTAFVTGASSGIVEAIAPELALSFFPPCGSDPFLGEVHLGPLLKKAHDQQGDAGRFGTIWDSSDYKSEQIKPIVQSLGGNQSKKLATWKIFKVDCFLYFQSIRTISIDRNAIQNQFSFRHVFCRVRVRAISFRLLNF
jgi:hypothetical protein